MYIIIIEAHRHTITFGFRTHARMVSSVLTYISVCGAVCFCKSNKFDERLHEISINTSAICQYFNLNDSANSTHPVFIETELIRPIGSARDSIDIFRSKANMCPYQSMCSLSRASKAPVRFPARRHRWVCLLKVNPESTVIEGSKQNGFAFRRNIHVPS